MSGLVVQLHHRKGARAAICHSEAVGRGIRAQIPRGACPERKTAVERDTAPGPLRARGDAATAAAAHDRAVVLSEGQDSRGLLLLRRSDFHLEGGRLEEAQSDAAQALAVEEKSAGPGTISSRVGVAHLALARALRAQGRTDEARAAASAAQKHLEPSVGAEHPDSRAARELAGNPSAAPRQD